MLEISGHKGHVGDPKGKPEEASGEIGEAFHCRTERLLICSSQFFGIGGPKRSGIGGEQGRRRMARAIAKGDTLENSEYG